VAYLPVNNSSAEALSSRNGDMVMKNGLMRIFWPTDAPTSPDPGVIVGLRNSDLDVLVVAILQHVEVRNAVSLINIV
jgi:phosphatidylinositol glycan class Q protein